MLLQSAADIVRASDWTALWRQSPNVGLSPDYVIKLDSKRQWLLVVDDAENLVRDLTESARRLHAAGRNKVHFLLAARDADWKFMRGDSQSWGGLIKKQKDIFLTGIESGEAQSIVEAWQRYGTQGLRALAALAPDKRSGVLETAVRDAAHVSGEGSLFGGLLATRFGHAAQKCRRRHSR